MKTLAAVRAGTLAMPKSEAGAIRQYATLWAQYREAYAGGGSFGFDRPTLRINEPEAYARMKHLYDTWPAVGL